MWKNCLGGKLEKEAGSIRGCIIERSDELADRRMNKCRSVTHSRDPGCGNENVAELSDYLALTCWEPLADLPTAVGAAARELQWIARRSHQA